MISHKNQRSLSRTGALDSYAADAGRKSRRVAESRFTLFLCLFGMILMPCASSAIESALTTTPPALEDVVSSIEQHYSSLVDLTAKVVQTNFLKSVGKTQKFEGALSVKKPGRLRLEYTNGQIFVIDGKHAWFFSSRNNQAIRRTFQDFEQANIPVAFLLGAGDLRGSFEVSVPDPGQPHLLELTPKKRGAAMKKLRLTVDDAGRITRMTVFDRSGNTSTVVFSDVREGVGLDESLFRFMVPKGTEIIEQ